MSTPGPSSSPSWAGLSTGTKVAGISAIVLLIATFLPWIGASASFGGVSSSATGSGIGEFWLGRLAALCAVAVLVVIAIELFRPDTVLPVAPSLLVLGLGALAVVCVGWHVLFLPSEFGDVPEIEGEGFSFEAGRRWGVFVALLAAIGTAVGGYLKLSDR